MAKDSKAKKQKAKILSFVPTAEYYFSKGVKAYQRRDFHKAKKYFLRALQLEPGEPMITCQLAVLYTEMGEYQQSNRLLHSILDELDEELFECHYFLANNYAHLGLFKDAYHHASLYMQLEPFGEFFEETEDLLEVLTLEADEVEDDDFYEHDDLIVQQEQARNLLESGHFPKAIEALTAIIENYPEYWSAYNNLALAYFYLGESEKAFEILHDVLEKNPGNLHAMCNRLVFAYYQQDHDEVNRLKEVLIKIKPLLVDHQYKLGTTFALIKEYDHAYTWLRKLQKQGFDGEGSFYYWLAYACYFTGHKDSAQTAWKKVLEANPEKAGFEPWSENKGNYKGFEEHIPSIMKKMDSEYIEERLFAIFLTSVSSKKEEILSSIVQKRQNKFSSLENEYFSWVKSESNQATITFPAHESAKILYNHHQPVGSVESGLYLMWFSVYVKMTKENLSLKNERALAAAVEYIWLRFRNNHVTQKALARKYELSPTTIQKYVKLVKELLV
jgi:tetratricopeptide (TPR) repeat protein